MPNEKTNFLSIHSVYSLLVGPPLISLIFPQTWSCNYDRKTVYVVLNLKENTPTHTHTHTPFVWIKRVNKLLYHLVQCTVMNDIICISEIDWEYSHMMEKCTKFGCSFAEWRFVWKTRCRKARTDIDSRFSYSWTLLSCECDSDVTLPV